MYSRMNEEKLAVLRERYADTENGILAKELGVSIRTVARWGAALGLRKSPDLIEKIRYKAYLGWQYLRLTGGNIGGGAKKGGTSGSFGQRKLTEEEERKRVDAIRKTAWEERKRVLRGESRKTRWRMVDYGKKKVDGKWQKA